MAPSGASPELLSPLLDGDGTDRVERRGFAAMLAYMFGEREGARYVDPFWVRFKTRFIGRISTTTDRKVRLGTVRGMRFTRVERRMAPGHSHPEAAALRSDASVFITSVASALGKKRYDISVSARERGGLATGPRQFRVTKDLLSDSSQARLGPTDLVSMIDTDYYLSKAELSWYAGHDMAMYSLRPDGISGATKESVWSFMSADEVTEVVSGGAEYSHKVWDWGMDLAVLGRQWKTYVYDVVNFQVGPARVVTVLVLARTVHIPLWLFRWLYPDAVKYEPRRMTVEQHGRYLVGSFGGPSGSGVSIKPAGSMGVSAVHISQDTFFALSVAAKIPNTDRKVALRELLPSGAERICHAAGEKVNTAGCHLLADYFSTGFRPAQLVNYQSVGHYKLEDGKPGAVLAAVPLVGPGVAPTASANNEARAIKARVTDVANNKPFSDELISYGKEFSELVITRTHKGVPWSIEELRTEQPRPTQRARRIKEEAFTADNRNSLTTTSFQKRETYPKVGDPRLINQVPTDHTNRLCAFAGAFKTALAGRSNGHWFMVGKTPLGIAHALRNLRRHATGRLVGGDYSRMDGRTSVAYRRHILQECMLRFFHPRFHGELKALLAREETARTVTRGHGVRASMGGANLSGSGVTTVLNTLDSAFNEFAARRRKGASAQEAFKRLGCYFGDDSAVSPDVFDATVAVATECGMKLEKEEIPETAGDNYVVFLSRVYPDIVTSLSSHPCMVRALRKACTVQAPPDASYKELCIKLRLKTEGILAADPHVPILSDYARAVQRVLHLDRLKCTGSEWADAISKDSSYQHKVKTGAYPYSDGDRELLLASIATSLGLTCEEVELVVRRLSEATTEDQLLRVARDDGAVLPSWAVWVPTHPVAT